MRFTRIMAASIAALSLAGGLSLADPALADSPAPITGSINARSANDLAEFLKKKTALQPDDISGRVDLARWAAQHELWTQAGDLGREVLAKDPANRPAWTILQQVDQAIPMPPEPRTEAALIDEFNRRFGRDNRTPARASAMFKTRNSRHFLLCYDTTDAFAASRGAALENVYDAFMFYFNMQKLRPEFLQKRLVVILFKNRADYLAYAKATEGANLSWAAGYYSQRTNRTAFYDDSTSPAGETAEHQIAMLRERLAELNAEIQQARDRSQNSLAAALTAQRDRLGSAIYQGNTIVGNTLGLMNTVKTAHEAAHQLAFNTGIQKRLVDYPLWFSEGLACSFEVQDAAGHRGPAVLNPGRIAAVKDALRRGKLIGVEDFVTKLPPVPMDEATLGVFYGEGWALFHYLYKNDRAGVEKFLLAYQALPILRQVNPVARRKLFTDAFGDDFPALQTKFTAYVKALPDRTPH